MEKAERRLLKKKIVITKIPEKIVESYEEVDTLQEFLKEFGLTEEQLRVAAKEYVEDQVTQPKPDMSDIKRLIDLGISQAEKINKRIDKKLELTDPYVVDALVKNYGWSAEKRSNPLRYIVQR